ncbi:phytochrome E-like [Punica granatum]|uniref:Phytochrome E-like n=1 Tax=Punica granatum TaxID=22663 RepID=A0A6P8BQ54_PUNGR|nr:phytochrome E-like [Punica granatum]
MKNALNGIRFTHQLLEGTAISDDQKQVLETSDACERQIMAIIDNIDIMNIEEGTIEFKMEELLLGSVLDAVVSQVMIPLREKKLQLFHEVPQEMKKLSLMTRPGQGRPSALIIDMFDGGKRWTIQEGLRLNLSRKLLNRMNGRVNC